MVVKRYKDDHLSSFLFPFLLSFLFITDICLYQKETTMSKFSYNVEEIWHFVP